MGSGCLPGRPVSFMQRSRRVGVAWLGTFTCGCTRCVGRVGATGGLPFSTGGFGRLVMSEGPEAALGPAFNPIVAGLVALTLEPEIVADPVQAARRNAIEITRLRSFIVTYNAEAARASRLWTER
jgi:hypothetical protein